jgi:hypothetical protein
VLAKGLRFILKRLPSISSTRISKKQLAQKGAIPEYIREGHKLPWHLKVSTPSHPNKYQEIVILHVK